MMDRLDTAILLLVQNNNLLSNSYIGEKVGLSASAVKRRLARLRQNGVIIADAALVDPGVVGVTAIVQIAFKRNSNDVYAAFRALIKQQAEVSQCYTIAGDFDFLAIVHASTTEAYEKWAQRTLTNNDAVSHFDSQKVYARTKFTTGVEPVSVVSR